MATRIITGEEAARGASLDAERHIHTNVVATGEHMQLVWAHYEPDAKYTLHTHEHEQFSVLLQGRMRLSVGEEVREIGPGDMWHAPAHVPHGGEIVGDEAVVFIDIYGPPSKTILEYVERLQSLAIRAPTGAYRGRDALAPV